MDRLSLEVKVGLVVTAAVGLVLAFLVFLGEYNPFTNTYRITVTLNYAGGIKPGSDVHLAGAKVGKVDAIKFFSAEHKEDAPVLGLELLIDKRATDLIREDSTFAVHMESLLGGKIVEITPGSTGAVLKEGAVVRGVEPPQLEALLNEAVAMIDEVKKFMEGLGPEDRERFRKLLLSLTRFGPEDVDDLRRVIHNTADATDDLKHMTEQIRPDLKPLLDELRSTLRQADPLLRNANTLVGKLDRTMTELQAIMPEDTEAVRAKVEELINTADDLAAVIDRLDRFTAYVETEYSDMDRQNLERALRQFLQQEGVTINVGTIAGKPDYPEPPPPSNPSSKNPGRARP